jgi:hypothetical protein
MKKWFYGTALAALLSCGTAGIVANGNFEEWQDGRPVGWEFNEGIYEQEPLFKVSNGYALRMKTPTEQKALWQNNTIRRQLKLEPDTEYILDVNAAKDDTGTFQFDVIPLVNGKRQKGIAYFNRWVWGFPYTTFSRTFRTGAGSDYLLEIRHFGLADSYCYLDRVAVRKKDGSGAAFAPGLYRMSSMQHFDGQLTEAAAPLKSLEFVAARNETESVTVLWKSAGVSRQAELRVKSSDGIPPEAIMVRDLIDSVLPVSRPRDVAAGETVAWQVFVKTTPDLKPGSYAAELELRADGRVQQSIPVHIQVVDVTLPPPEITFLLYHSEGYMPERFLTPELRDLYYRDLAEHGMNSITLYNNPQNGKEADFRYNYSFDEQLIPEKFRERNDKNDPLKRYDRVHWRKIFDLGLEAQMELAARHGLVNKQHPILWLPVKPGNYGFGGMPAPALKDALRQWRAHENWPEPLLYVMDEPYDLPDRIAGALAIFKNLRENSVDVRTVTAHPHPDILGSYYDVWILGTAQINVRNMKKALDMKREVWAYNCSVTNSNAPFFRAMYGYWAHQNELKGVATWAYYDAREKFVEQPDGTIRDASTRLSRVGLSPSGPVPTVAWEGTREGTEDYRLIQLYESLMKQLEQARRSSLEESAKALSAADQQAIARREQAVYRKKDPKNPSPSWTAGTPEKENAEKAYLQYLELDRVYRSCKQGWRLLESVGSLAPVARSIDENILGTWYPDLGESNMAEAAEQKRKMLLLYVIRLQETLNRR